jgi:hypothetical protein
MTEGAATACRTSRPTQTVNNPINPTPILAPRLVMTISSTANNPRPPEAGNEIGT